MPIEEPGEPEGEKVKTAGCFLKKNQTKRKKNQETLQEPSVGGQVKEIVFRGYGEGDPLNIYTKEHGKGNQKRGSRSGIYKGIFSTIQSSDRTGG